MVHRRLRAGPEDERARAEEHKQRLTFSPMEQPERLKETTAGADADAKKVLAVLTTNAPDRRAGCLETSIASPRP